MGDSVSRPTSAEHGVGVHKLDVGWVSISWEGTADPDRLVGVHNRLKPAPLSWQPDASVLKIPLGQISAQGRKVAMAQGRERALFRIERGPLPGLLTIRENGHPLIEKPRSCPTGKPMFWVSKDLIGKSAPDRLVRAHKSPLSDEWVSTILHPNHHWSKSGCPLFASGR